MRQWNNLVYKNSSRWTCKCPKHVEAIYENKIIVKLFASSWYISLLTSSYCSIISHGNQSSVWVDSEINRGRVFGSVRWPFRVQVRKEFLSDLHKERSPTQSGIYQRLYWYNWFSWWWARGCSKHNNNNNNVYWLQMGRHPVAVVI